MKNALSYKAHDAIYAALMELKVSQLLKFMNDELIKKPKIRRKSEYASAIAEHFNRQEIRIDLSCGALKLDIATWRK